jgi:hypothetical protein
MAGNPTGCMGLPDYLGWDWKSKADIPIVRIPGCPTQPDNLTQTILQLLYFAAGRAPMIALDDELRPLSMFSETVHEGCDPASQVEHALLERKHICEDFFLREAPRLASACQEMSDRFRQGGRLLAFGRGPYATDGQHVLVEFVHR